MSMNRILNELRSNESEFITSNSVRDYSNKLNYKVGDVMKYFTSQKYIFEVLNDMFYLTDVDEFQKKELKYSQYELISKALAFKNINTWYFGLNTALTFDSNEKNDVFFENNKNINYVINNRFSGDKLIINGDIFSFLIFKKELLNFGIKDNGKYRYSNLEKTILDYVYLYNSNQVREGKIITEIMKYKNFISIERIKKYSKHYPANVAAILEKAKFYGQ